ncbi:DUF4124 domain-containing protein [Marinobacter shengliensis]|uniref:DUF4124 domain-containing protein n=1 Tax=Marinobacter shengliensis TaxID=1389223 RepID=UPI0011096375|nr:DUF4124 domain-containing protein [Marinobacter shengliensis]
MPRIKALPFCLCLFLSLPAQAEIYRWTDANGSIHFSDTPPMLDEHHRMQVRPTTTMPMAENIRQSDRVTRNRKELDQLLSPNSKNRYAKSQQAEEARTRQCEQYRKQLDRLQARLRAGYGNDRGNSLRQRRRELSQTYSHECVLN